MYQKLNVYNNLVYKTKYNFDYESIEYISNILLKDYDKFEEEKIHINSYSSFHNPIQPHRQLQFKNFYNFIKPIYLDIIINKWNYPKNLHYGIGNSWINKYENNGYIKEHMHDNTICVVSAYVTYKKNAGNLLFQDPYYNFKKKLIPSINDDDLFCSIELEQGDIVFFQGGMVHKSEPNLSNYERIVLTTNISVVDENKII